MRSPFNFSDIYDLRLMAQNVKIKKNILEEF